MLLMLGLHIALSITLEMDPSCATVLSGAPCCCLNDYERAPVSILNFIEIELFSYMHIKLQQSRGFIN